MRNRIRDLRLIVLLVVIRRIENKERLFADFFDWNSQCLQLLFQLLIVGNSLFDLVMFVFAFVGVSRDFK